MATKKQKRQAMQEQRAQFEEDLRQEGLKAQQRDREIRAAKKERAASDAERRNRRQQNAGAVARVSGAS